MFPILEVKNVILLTVIFLGLFIAIFIDGFFLNRFELKETSPDTLDVFGIFHNIDSSGGHVQPRQRAFTAGDVQQCILDHFSSVTRWSEENVQAYTQNVSLLTVIAESDRLSFRKPLLVTPPVCSSWWCQEYDQVVFILIDALRFDFLAYNTTSTSSLPYINKFPSVHRALKAAHHTSPLSATSTPSISTFPASPAAPSRNSFARMFRFRADAPTVTMQRLKALATGGLPTFIDIKDNFQSSAVTEDNWLAQARRKGRRMIHMGDDTWESLFPKEFSEMHPFPSFNVQDLDTVDSGCNTHLWPALRCGNDTGVGDASVGYELDNTTSASALLSPPPPASAAASSGTCPSPWAVVVAHYLGVDHVGHRHGPTHPEMSRKLGEMDTVVRRLVGYVDAERVKLEGRDRVAAGRTPMRNGGGRADGSLGASYAAVNGSGRESEGGSGGTGSNSGKAVLLLVLGDHGMTGGGNHGGASADETDAGLFAYSSVPLMGASETRVVRGKPLGNTGEARVVPGESPAGAEVSRVERRSQMSGGLCDAACVLRVAERGWRGWLDTLHSDILSDDTLHSDRASAEDVMYGYGDAADVAGASDQAAGSGGVADAGDTVGSRDDDDHDGDDGRLAATAWQVDLVPVLAAALGVPTPLGSLGTAPRTLMRAHTGESVCALVGLGRHSGRGGGAADASDGHGHDEDIGTWHNQNDLGTRRPLSNLSGASSLSGLDSVSSAAVRSLGNAARVLHRRVVEAAQIMHYARAYREAAPRFPAEVEENLRKSLGAGTSTGTSMGTGTSAGVVGDGVWAAVEVVERVGKALLQACVEEVEERAEVESDRQNGIATTDVKTHALSHTHTHTLSHPHVHANVRAHNYVRRRARARARAEWAEALLTATSRLCHRASARVEAALVAAKSGFQREWAQFNAAAMALGLCGCAGVLLACGGWVLLRVCAVRGDACTAGNTGCSGAGATGGGSGCADAGCSAADAWLLAPASSSRTHTRAQPASPLPSLSTSLTTGLAIGLILFLSLWLSFGDTLAFPPALALPADPHTLLLTPLSSLTHLPSRHTLTRVLLLLPGVAVSTLHTLAPVTDATLPAWVGVWLRRLGDVLVRAMGVVASGTVGVSDAGGFVDVDGAGAAHMTSSASAIATATTTAAATAAAATGADPTTLVNTSTSIAGAADTSVYSLGVCACLVMCLCVCVVWVVAIRIMTEVCKHVCARSRDKEDSPYDCDSLYSANSLDSASSIYNIQYNKSLRSASSSLPSALPHTLHGVYTALHNVLRTFHHVYRSLRSVLCRTAVTVRLQWGSLLSVIVLAHGLFSNNCIELEAVQVAAVVAVLLGAVHRLAVKAVQVEVDAVGSVLAMGGVERAEGDAVEEAGRQRAEAEQEAIEEADEGEEECGHGKMGPAAILTTSPIPAAATTKAAAGVTANATGGGDGGVRVDEEALPLLRRRCPSMKHNGHTCSHDKSAHDHVRDVHSHYDTRSCGASLTSPPHAATHHVSPHPHAPVIAKPALHTSTHARARLQRARVRRVCAWGGCLLLCVLGMMLEPTLALWRAAYTLHNNGTGADSKDNITENNPSPHNGDGYVNTHVGDDGPSRSHSASGGEVAFARHSNTRGISTSATYAAPSDASTPTLSSSSPSLSPASLWLAAVAESDPPVSPLFPHTAPASMAALGAVGRAVAGVIGAASSDGHCHGHDGHGHGGASDHAHGDNHHPQPGPARVGDHVGGSGNGDVSGSGHGAVVGVKEDDEDGHTVPQTAVPATSTRTSVHTTTQSNSPDTISLSTASTSSSTSSSVPATRSLPPPPPWDRQAHMRAALALFSPDIPLDGVSISVDSASLSLDTVSPLDSVAGAALSDSSYSSSLSALSIDPRADFSLLRAILIFAAAPVSAMLLARATARAVHTLTLTSAATPITTKTPTTTIAAPSGSCIDAAAVAVAAGTGTGMGTALGTGMGAPVSMSFVCFVSTLLHTLLVLPCLCVSAHWAATLTATSIHALLGGCAWLLGTGPPLPMTELWAAVAAHVRESVVELYGLIPILNTTTSATAAASVSPPLFLRVLPLMPDPAAVLATAQLLRRWLPRVAYACSALMLMMLVLVVIVVVWRGWRPGWWRGMGSGSDGDVLDARPPPSASALISADASPSAISPSGDPSATGLPLPASLLALLLLPALTPTLMVLGGPRAALPYACFLVALLVLARVHGYITQDAAHGTIFDITHSQAPGTSCSSSPHLALSWVHACGCLLHWLGWLLYYCTGHAYGFADLHVSAAFVGAEAYAPVRAALMVLGNTYGGLLMATVGAVALPALAAAWRPRDACEERALGGWERVCACVCGNDVPARAPVSELHACDCTRGMCPVPRVPAPAHDCDQWVGEWLAPAWMLTVVRCVLVTVNVAVQRRHLMVWAIFAPKFIMDIGASVVIALGALVPLVMGLCVK